MIDRGIPRISRTNYQSLERFKKVIAGKSRKRQRTVKEQQKYHRVAIGIGYSSSLSLFPFMTIGFSIR